MCTAHSASGRKSFPTESVPLKLRSPRTTMADSREILCRITCNCRFCDFLPPPPRHHQRGSPLPDRPKLRRGCGEQKADKRGGEESGRLFVSLFLHRGARAFMSSPLLQLRRRRRRRRRAKYPLLLLDPEPRTAFHELKL